MEENLQLISCQLINAIHKTFLTTNANDFHFHCPMSHNLLAGISMSQCVSFDVDEENVQLHFPAFLIMMHSL